MKRLLGFILLISLVGCKSNDFSGVNANATQRSDGADGAGSTGVPSTEGATDGEGGHLEKKFEIGVDSIGADILWLMANDQPMAEEIALVQANFGRFVTDLKKTVDTKLAVISCSLGSVNDDEVCIDYKGLGVGSEITIIDTAIGTTDSLAAAAAAVCPPETTSFPAGQMDAVDGKICDIPVFGLEIEADDVDYNRIKGSLKDFFRPTSRAIVVVVSDDTAAELTATQFAGVMDKKYGKDGWIFYGFVGLPTSVASPTCTIVSVSTEYQMLAANTKGQLFDLCAADWSANFSRLSTDIITKTTKTFVVSDTATVKVVKVLHNGATVPSDKYSVTGGTVTLADDYAVAKGDKVTVVYDNQ